MVNPVVSEMVNPVVSEMVNPVVSEMVNPVVSEMVNPVVSEMVNPVKKFVCPDLINIKNNKYVMDMIEAFGHLERKEMTYSDLLLFLDNPQHMQSIGI